MSQNPADTLVAGLIFGAVLVLAGQGIIRLACSVWAERKAQKAEATVTETPEELAARLADAEWRAIQVALESVDRSQSHLAAVAPVVPLRGSVPQQRGEA